MHQPWQSAVSPLGGGSQEAVKSQVFGRHAGRQLTALALVDGGGGSPGGSDTQVQYNSSGAFAGSAYFTWDDANLRLYLGADGGQHASVPQLVFLDYSTQSGGSPVIVWNNGGGYLQGIGWDGTGGTTIKVGAVTYPFDQTWGPDSHAVNLRVTGGLGILGAAPTPDRFEIGTETAVTNPVYFFAGDYSTGRGYGAFCWNSAGPVEAIGPADGAATGNIRVGKIASLPSTWESGRSTTLLVDALQSAVKDSATNAVTTVVTVQHNTSGTPAAGFGSSLLWQLDSSTTANQNAAEEQALWATATHASRKGRWAVGAHDASTSAGSPRWGVFVESSGSAAMLGFYGAAAVVQYSTTGTTAGFTAGAGAAVDSAATFTGNTGSTAYTISDIVKALKLLGLIAT